MVTCASGIQKVSSTGATKRTPMDSSYGGRKEKTMERIYPKKTEQISLYEAAQLLKCGKEPFVLYPTDEQAGTYERQTLEEFLEDCMFFITR